MKQGADVPRRSRVLSGVETGTTNKTTRRHFVAALGVGALVFGFDPARRTWVSLAQASGRFDRVPRLDGTLMTDPSSLAPYATDAGSIVHNTPIAVLVPGSVRDIQKMVKFCRERRIKIAARGQGHTTFGQSQVAGGLVIDMKTISDIHEISANRAVLGAGATWKELVNATVPLGLTPPVLTGYINLSIGGTLSVGGVSRINRQGCQVDRVRELEVVTGEGELKRCSARNNSDLFEALLGGLGQCGIITQATVDLIPAKPLARTFHLNYLDNAAFFADLRILLERNEFDGVFMLGAPDGAGGWVRQINAIKYHDTGTTPDPTFLLRGLTQPPSNAEIVDETYLAQVQSVDVVIDFFKSVGLWDGVLHPWFDVWLPDDGVESYVGETLAGLTPEDVGPTGFLLLFPQRRSALKRPFLRVPECGDWVFLFDILTAAASPGPDEEFEARMLARNRALFEEARSIGGTRYPIGSLEFSHSDWVRHYGREWNDFSRAKRRYDPEEILSPGAGIF